MYEFEQINIEEIVDNPIDDGPRKIREKETSLKNTLEKRNGVPVEQKKEVAVKSEYFESNDAPSETNLGSVEQVIKNVFNNTSENNDNVYDANVPITVAEEKVSDDISAINNDENEKEESNIVSFVDTKNESEFEDITSLTEKLKQALEEEKSEKNRVEEIRIRYEQSNEELRMTTEEYNEELNNLKDKIQQSIERKNEYTEMASEMDKKIADTIDETEIYKKKISYIKSLGDWQNEESKEFEYSSYPKVA